MLPLYIVFKRKTIPKKNFPKGVIVRCHEKGWVNEALVLDWIKAVWCPHPGSLLV